MPTMLETTVESRQVVGEERFLLSDISWSFYLAFCEEIGERPIRLSYSEGLLEIMITHAPHEFYKTMLAKLIVSIPTPAGSVRPTHMRPSCLLSIQKAL